MARCLRIVLRVPSGASGVTGEDTKSAFYIDLEKKLVQNGFIVRDRALLDRLLNTTYEDKDYVSIYNKIDTDIILQIDKIDLDEKIYPTSYIVNNEIVNDVDNKTFYIRLAEINARVVTVKEGEVGIFAKIYICATDEKGEVKYTVISEQRSTGALGISNSGVKTKIISNTPEDISFLYTELTTKLINAIKMK